MVNSMWNDGTNVLMHHGIKGQKWGIRRYQNEDGGYTQLGQQQNNGHGRYAPNKSNNNYDSSKNKSGNNSKKEPFELKKTTKTSAFKEQDNVAPKKKTESKIESIKKITQSKAFKTAVTSAVLVGGAVAVYAVVKNANVNGDCLVDEESLLARINRENGIVDKNVFYNDTFLDTSSTLYRTQPNEFKNLPEKFFFATANQSDVPVYQYTFGREKNGKFGNTLEIAVNRNIKIASVSSCENLYGELVKNEKFSKLVSRYSDEPGYTAYDKFIFAAPMDKEHPEAFRMFQEFMSSHGYGGIIDGRDSNRNYGQGTKAPMILFRESVKDEMSDIFKIKNIIEIDQSLVDAGYKYILGINSIPVETRSSL